MANAVSLTGRYVIEGLEIFVRPVTVLRRSADRGSLPLAVCLLTFVLVALFTEVLAALNGQFPRMGAVGSAFVWRFHIEPFLSVIALASFSTVTLYFGARLFGRDPSFARALSVNVSLVAAIGGGFVIAMLVKAAILIAAPFDPVLLQHVVWLGPQASMFLGAILLAYGIIAARFGALVSWPIALALAIIQMVALMATAFVTEYLFLSSELSSVVDFTERMRANQGN
ncbi:MAG: hypothetical protein AAFR13_06510 [Pseudomonadota bacterium]